MRVAGDAETTRDRLLERGILAGHPLGAFGADFGDALLVCTTEMTTRGQIDALAAALGEKA